MGTDKLKISPESNSDKPAINALFKQVFGRSMQANDFEWWKDINQWAIQSKEKNNVCDHPSGLVAYVDRTIAGYYGIRLRSCLVNGKTLVAGELVNVMVEKSFRNNGISRRMCSHLVNNLADWNIDILYGIPNQNSERSLTKAGMKIPLTYGRWTITINSRHLFRAKLNNRFNRLIGAPITKELDPKIILHPAAKCSSDLEPNWALDSNFLVRRSIDYWRFRYDNSPRNYTAISCTAGSCVIKLDAFGMRLSASLVDLMPVEKSLQSIKILIERALAYARNLGAQTFEVRAVVDSIQANVIQNLGLVRNTGDFPVAFAAVDETMIEFANNDSVWMTSGDFDIG